MQRPLGCHRARLCPRLWQQGPAGQGGSPNRVHWRRCFPSAAQHHGAEMKDFADAPKSVPGPPCWRGG